MFDNVLEKSDRPQVITSDSEVDSPVKKPAPPAKRKLGPPPQSKRKIVSSESDASPVKKKVNCVYKKNFEFMID